MQSDKFGNIIYSENDLVDLMYKDQLGFLPKIFLEKTANLEKLQEVSDINLSYTNHDFDSVSIEEFDLAHQSMWFMPEEYKNFDIANWILDQCTDNETYNRAQEELAEFQTRNMIPLLQWLKYLVDTCRSNNVVWGVGRGSSVSSFVLFLIGVHKIDPIKYNLDWREFLR